MNFAGWLFVAWALAHTSPSLRTLLLPGGITVFASAMSAGNDAPAGDRLDAASRPLLGAGYQASPLGEGEGPDPDPRLRFDAFDCTTFVETALALALCPSPGSIPHTLDRIRYRGESPSFLARRHFPEAEWLPELSADGVLRDVSAELAGDRLITVDRPAWPGRAPRVKQEHHLLPEVPASRLPRGRVKLAVVPFDLVRRSPETIPHGAIVSVVREPRSDRGVLVTHQGLVLAHGSTRVLRHASELPYRRVVDEPLEAFLRRASAWKHWPVLGLNVAVLEGRGCR